MSSKRDQSSRFSYRFGDERCVLQVRYVQDRFDVAQKQPYASIKFGAGLNVPGLIVRRSDSRKPPRLRS